VHPALRIALRHLLVQNPAARRHPLHVARAHLALVAQAVAVLHRARQHIRNRLDSAMRMPRKSLQIIGRILIAKIVQQQERIELLGLPETEGALQLHTRALQRRFGLNHFFNWSE
jgi:hypothetical protein